MARPGDTFGRLVVLDQYEFRTQPSGERRRHWWCRCSCGVRKCISQQQLQKGKTASCGCLQKDRVRAANTRHGHSTRKETSPEYSSWRAMKSRCLVEKDPGFKYYGAKGVKIHPPWIASFEAFLKDMGPRPLGTSLDRINPTQNYSPQNCRWANQETQGNNQRNTKRILWEGEEKSVTQWARILGIHPSTLQGRLKRGWSVEKAFSIPPQKKNTWEFTLKGRTQSLKAWADETGLKYATLRYRVVSGWPLEEAVQQPTN